MIKEYATNYKVVIKISTKQGDLETDWKPKENINLEMKQIKISKT